MRLLRHNEIYRSDVSLTSGKLDPECRLLNGSGPSYRTHQEEYALPIVCDEFRPGIPRSGWSPPEPVFASPARPACHGWTRERKRFSANGDLSLFKLSHLRGAVHTSVPSSGSLLSAPGKEPLQQFQSLGSAHTFADLQAVIEHSGICQAKLTPHAAKPQIARSEDQPADTRLHQGAGAHHTRLQSRI